MNTPKDIFKRAEEHRLGIKQSLDWREIDIANKTQNILDDLPKHNPANDRIIEEDLTGIATLRN